jgi:translation initiation factor 3 subunit A
VVPEDVKAIHALLESDFDPLGLCAKLAPLIDGLEARALTVAAPVSEAPLAQYKASLRRVAVLKMLSQLSQVGPGAPQCRFWEKENSGCKLCNV